MNHADKLADRLKQLPTYIFSQINELKAQATAKGISLISVAIGDPDLSTPPAIVKAMNEAIQKPENHGYSPYEGTQAFRQAVAKWFQNRFDVALDPKEDIIALIGSKEGIAHFPLAVCNPGDKAIYPSPGYPIFETAIMLSGGIPTPILLKPENQFLPDPKELEAMFVEHKPKFCLLNFPANPTSVMASRELLESIVAMAKKHNVILVYDNAYSEIYFDAKNKPMSLLQIDGAKDIAIEFHSLSKTFNMTGWRIGFAVGNPSLVKALLKIKTNIDSGPLMSVQQAAVYALEHSEELTNPIRAQYAERREYALKRLAKLQIESLPSEATFYIWAKVPSPYQSMDFCKRLIEEAGLVITPGIGFGSTAEGFFRISLTVDVPTLREAFDRLEKFLLNAKT